MKLDAEDRQFVLDTVADEGQSVIWKRQVKTLTDPQKPWLGTTTTPVSVPVRIFFVNVTTAAALIKAWRPDTELETGGLYGIMGDHGFEPAVTDIVDRNGTDIVVKSIATADPTGMIIFHVIEFQA